MRAWRTVGIVLLAILTAAVMALVAGTVSGRLQTTEQQNALQPFYDVPSPLPGPPGTVIRTEPLGVTVPGATALRMLYVSERPDGTPAASGGMLFIPDSPAPPEGRPVVAWAHGTLGMGDACVPSRSTNPLQDTDNWLDQMMQLGWVVVSTDYVGLGTPGPNQYLIAQSEVRDVVNAVRAARNTPQAEAGTRYATWGHSQGGHSSVWTGHLGEEYAPELDLLGVAAAAPALNLPEIMGAQWDNVVGWVIGPDVIESWPTYYPDLPVDEVLTSEGRDSASRLAGECIKESALEGLAREKLGQQFFAVDPLTVAPWADAAIDQTPATPARGHARLHLAGNGGHRRAAVAQRHGPGGVVRGWVVDQRAVDGRHLAPGRRHDVRAERGRVAGRPVRRAPGFPYLRHASPGGARAPCGRRAS